MRWVRTRNRSDRNSSPAWRFQRRFPHSRSLRSEEHQLSCLLNEFPGSGYWLLIHSLRMYRGSGQTWPMNCVPTTSYGFQESFERASRLLEVNPRERSVQRSLSRASILESSSKFVQHTSSLTFLCPRLLSLGPSDWQGLVRPLSVA